MRLRTELQDRHKVPAELKDNITSYIFESGLDLGMLNTNRKLIVQGLIVYNVIHNRRTELDDIAKGEDFKITKMYRVSQKKLYPV